MEVETTGKAARKIPKNTLIIGLIAFTLMMLAITGQFTYTVLKSDKVYNGINIGQQNVGGMSRQDLTNFLEANYSNRIKDLKISINAKNFTESIDFSKAGVKYDVSAAVEQAFQIGRTGNMFERLSEIIQTSVNTTTLAVPYTFDKETINVAIQSIYSKIHSPVKEASLEITESKVVLTSGQHGESIEKDKLFNNIEEMIGKCTGGNIEVPIVMTSPKKIDVEALYKEISLETIDAKAEVKDNQITVTPHTVGRSINKTSLSSIVQEIGKTENSPEILPVEFIQPKFTTEMLNAKLLKDTLGKMHTQFYTGNQNDANRGVNIRLAVSKINGTVLAPGQVFSFNEVVGPRTAAGGYKAAHAYIGGKIVDDIGGGICQVSTTLYNSVLFSDMEVTQRTNHMFTVGYVPYGRDAAVSYPDVDFKFRNSSSLPIKIEGWVTPGNQIHFAIKGTNENPGKTISINPQTVSTIAPPPVTYIDDPTLPEGTEKVEQSAMTGFIIDTYKIVKQDGTVVSNEKIHRSNYKALGKKVRRGTMKVETPVDATVNPPVNPEEIEQQPPANETVLPPSGETELPPAGETELPPASVEQ